MDILSCWQPAKDIIQKQIGETALKIWIDKLGVRSDGQDTLILSAPDEYFKNLVIKNYSALIENSLKEITKRDICVQFVAEDSPDETTVQASAGAAQNWAPASEPVTLPKGGYPILNLNPRFTFENFVVGPSNSFAHAASIAVSESPAKAYNPLFIYGGVGLGKTHLMQAICNYLLVRRADGYKISYVSSEKFTNELIDAIQHHSTGRFRQKYRNVDVLVIDDVHFIAGKEATQEEFFHTFNTLYDAHKQIIISSDRTPKDIPNMEERLVSRFGWGLVTDIQPPNFETRVAILKKKIEREPVNVPSDVVFFIAEIIKTNIRELEGALIRVIAYSLLENKQIDLGLAKNILKDMLKESVKTITVDLIQKKVGAFFNLTQADLKETKRNRNIVQARQIAMYLARELTNLSLPEIGGFFGGKDHTTVLHSYKKIKAEAGCNPELKNNLEQIIRVIKQ